MDALALVLEGVQAGGLSSIELGAELSLDLSFRDAINWTRQMTELMRVDGGTQDYFAMMLSSMALNSANFVSAIGMDIKLAVRLKTEGVFEALPSLLAGGNVAAADILPMLRGAMIYLEIALDTNFFGEAIADPDVAPIQLWVEVSDDDELYLNIYLIAPDLGTVTGLTGEYGDFFAQGVKLENAISLIDLIPVEAAAKDATDEAVIAAESSGGGIVIDTTGKDVGMVPDNIWGVLDLLLGEVILTHDMLSVGITEDLLGGLIGALVPEFPAEDIKYLPTFKVTGGADSSGIKLLVGDADLTVKVELGIVGGFDDFAPVSEIEAALSNASSNDTLNNLLFEESVYKINKDNLNEFIGTLRVTASTDEDGNTIYTEGGNDVIISTSEYALAPNASPAEVWLGTRYELTRIEDGKPVFTDLSYEQSYKDAFKSDPNGEYILVPEDSDLGSFESVDEDGNKVMVEYAGTYMLAERYTALGGVVTDDIRYAIDASKIHGEYVRLGDVNIALELGGLYLSVNQPFSAGTVDSEGQSIYRYRDMLNIAGAKEVPGIRLHTEIEVGFWGNEGSGLNLGELIDMLLGIDALKQLLGGVELVGTDLTLDITGDFGSQTEAYFTVALDAYFDFTGELQAKLTVMRGDVALLGVILAHDAIYIDLGGVLGETVKARISDLGLTAMLQDALSGVFGGAVASGEAAVTASISSTAGMTLHDYAYLAAVINPGYFSLQLTLAAVQAIIEKVNADNPDLALDLELPDLGDIMLESYGGGKGGSMLALNFKMSEDFGVSIDITKVNIGTERIYTTDDIYVNDAGDYVVREDGEEVAYKQLLNVDTGELADDLTLSATGNINLSMTSEGLKPGDDDYDNSLAGWVIGLLTDMLGANSFFVSPFTTADEEYIKYEGPLYTKGEDSTGATVYNQVGTTIEGDTAQFLGTDGKKKENYSDYPELYRTTMIEATFASGDINLGIELEANINLGAIIAAGLGGILFSDLRVAVTLGEPFNTTILEVYYLGSSRLVKQGNIYDLKAEAELTEQQQGAFSDAIYIDASGLGLGKIKFQGIAGLLGGNVGNAYQGVYQSSAATAAEPEDTDAPAEETTTISIALGIDLAENYIGINIDKSLIDFVLNNLLGESLATAGISSLPDIQSLELAFAFGTSSVDSISLDATVDGAGTGLHLTIDDLALGLENTLDTEDLVNKVKKQFAGITYSKTAGVMTLLQNLLDSLDANLALTVDKRGRSLVQSTSSWGNGWGAAGADFEAAATNFRSTIRALSTSGMYDIAANGNLSGDGGAFTSFMLKLDVSAKHPHIGTALRGVDTVDLDVYFGNNNLWVNDIGIDLGSAGDIIGIFASTLLNWINIGNFIDPDTGKLFDFAYSDADSGTWADTNPVATTASDGAANVAADDWPYGTNDDDLTLENSWTHGASASTNDDSPYKFNSATNSSEYSYPLNLTGLVDKVEVNLFNSTGYQPYLEYMTNTSISAESAASLISVKVELNKYAYNELLVFLYTTILSLLHGAIDANQYTAYYFSYLGGNMYEGTNNAGLPSTNTELANHPYNTAITRHSSGDKERKWVISNLFRELDSIAYMDDRTEQEKTERRVQLLDPYVRSLPMGLLEWLLYDMLHSVGDGIVSNNAPGVGALAGSALGDITILIASLLPPFASMDANAVNPSLNLYIDLAPESSFYGQGTKEIAPGIQAIELMVNAEKNGDGRQLVQYYTGSDGQRVAREGEIYYTIDESATVQNMVDAWVLAINPSNLVVDSNNKTYEGKGVLKLLEAGSAAQPTLPIDKIVVDDVGTKSATAYNGNDVVGTGTLNGDWLVNGLGLPQTARVDLVSPTAQKDVVLIWDAGALDFSPSALEENNRLAGYVYGYALNLVVAMIPVYVTDSQYFEGVYEVSNGGKGAAVSLNWTGGDTAIADDLVYIGFRNGNGYVFGKQAVDELTGDPLYAVLRNGNTVYMLKTTTTTDAEGNVTVTSEFGFYDINIQDTETDAYTVAVYPAYTAYTDGTNVVVRDATYRVLRNGGADITDPKALPVGTFSWDLNGLDYGWDGMDGDKTVTVGISYQWGFSATQTHDVTLSISSALIDSVESGYTYTDPKFETAYGSWSEFVEALGLSDMTLAEARPAIVEYFNDLGITGGNFVNADGNGGAIGRDNTVVGWDLTELLNAMARRPGRNVTVDITMYVGGFNVWKELQETDLGVGGAWEYVRGFADDFLINVDGAWVMNPSADQVQKVYNNVGGNMGFVAAAQPVTVTISIGEEGGFEWATPAAPAPAPTPDTYVFSDGSSATQQDGVMTYTITTAAQLYGAMPESGSVVQPDGTAMKAKFDWNGFVYDTTRTSDVAHLTVSASGETVDTDVLVTLADNEEVNGAVEGSTPEGGDTATVYGVITEIVSPAYRAMSVDPMEYGTLGAFIEAHRPALPYDRVVNEETGETEHVDGGTLEVVTEAGETITVNVVSWSDKLASDVALPLAGARYPDNIATFEDANGNLYQAVVPIVINERVIVDTKIVLPDAFKLVSETRRFSDDVRRYADRTNGQVIEVSYSRDTHLPTGITVMNVYRYADEAVFSGTVKIAVTFEAGNEVNEYTFVIKDLPEVKSAASEVSKDCGYELRNASDTAAAFSGTLEVTFSALRVNAGNLLSDIAYGDLDGTAVGTYQDFAPYANMTLAGKTLLTPHETNGAKLTSNVRVFIDGRFVLVSALDSYTGTADGKDAPRYVELKDASGKGYRYDADGNFDANGTYAYVYAAEYTIAASELTWNHSGITYNYIGGNRNTSVTVAHSGVTGTLTMPIRIVNGTVTNVTFVDAVDGSYAGYFGGDKGNSDYFAENFKNGVYTFDPFDGLDIDEPVMRKEVVEGKEVDVFDYYVYIPKRVDLETESGAVIKDVEVEWINLAAVRNSYRGGTFDVRFNVPAPVVTTTAEDGTESKSSPFGAQNYTWDGFIKVIERTIVAGTTIADGEDGYLDSLPATGRVWKAGEYSGEAPKQTYIDPIEFNITSFRTQLEAAVPTVYAKITGMENPVAFDLNDNDGNGFTLTWVYTDMTVNYLGGLVTLVARLTGPDGYSQDYEIDYLVSRRVVAMLEEYDKINKQVVSGGEKKVFEVRTSSENFGRSIDVDNASLGNVYTGQTASAKYTVQPYDPSTFSLPNAWRITYAVQDPTYENGNIVWNNVWRTDAGTEKWCISSYLSPTMPTGANITYDLAVNGTDSAGDAMIRVESGQRVRISVEVAPKGKYEGDGKIGLSGGKLPASVDGYSIVWYGRVFIDGASYIVSFSAADADSSGNIPLPKIAGRSATYVLTPYIGAVTNANGKVLDWASGGYLPLSSQATITGYGSAAEQYKTLGEGVGDKIPSGYVDKGRKVPAGKVGYTRSFSVDPNGGVSETTN